MKRFTALVSALCLLLALFGCSEFSQGRTKPSNPIRFYYRLAEDPFNSDDGILGSERYDFGAKIPTLLEIFTQYFSGPTGETLVSPFPAGLEAKSVSLDNGVLTVTLDDSFSTLTGVNYTIAAACITRTMTQVEGVNSVCIETVSQHQLESSVPLSSADYVCREIATGDTETTVRLYFSDVNGRYLVAEERKNTFSDASQIPAYLIGQLIAGPQEKGSLATIPEGTKLLSVSVADDGTCTVDLSSEFLLNKPRTELLERMTVFSIVDSLTELKQISKVRLLIEGKPVTQYLDMDLSKPLVRDDAAIGVVRAGMNEADATLYVNSGQKTKLASVPVGVRKTSNGTETEALLQLLLNFKARNSLSCPIPSGTGVQSVGQEDGICHVDFSQKFLNCVGDETAEKLAVRSVAATLCTLDGITGVRISVNGSSSGLRYVDLGETFSPEPDWFFDN